MAKYLHIRKYSAANTVERSPQVTHETSLLRYTDGNTIGHGLRQPYASPFWRHADGSEMKGS